MNPLLHRHALVIGLGASGQAATRLLRAHGTQVTALDQSRTPSLEQIANEWQARGVRVHLGAEALPEGRYDLGVLSPGVPPSCPLVREAVLRGIPLVSELEFGFQHSLCPNVSITGTNGKTTTTELVERMLTHARRQVRAAGNIGLPISEIADQTQNLDFLVLEVSSFQLEAIQFFRSAVAVLLNVTPDHLDRYANMADYTRAKARLFLNQQPFDWAIVQSEALAQLRALNLPVPSRIITFSASDRRADLYLDRGLLVSRLPAWTGPWLDMDECQLQGPHNAENLMAALAVGRVLQVPLEPMAEALKSYRPAAHRCERVDEVNGVVFINDSKATNLDAVAKALQAVPGAQFNEPNVWLIAGGKDKGFEFHSIGPVLARRVKHAFLLGETRERIRAAWSHFTPCTLVTSLEEAVVKAFEAAVPGDVILLSPACSSFDLFRNYQHRGEVFRQAVSEVARTARGRRSPETAEERRGCDAGCVRG